MRRNIKNEEFLKYGTFLLGNLAQNEAIQVFCHTFVMHLKLAVYRASLVSRVVFSSFFKSWKCIPRMNVRTFHAVTFILALISLRLFFYLALIDHCCYALDYLTTDHEVLLLPRPIVPSRPLMINDSCPGQLQLRGCMPRHSNYYCCNQHQHQIGVCSAVPFFPPRFHTLNWTRVRV